jgi:predicted ferric reductase
VVLVSISTSPTTPRSGAQPNFSPDPLAAFSQPARESAVAVTVAVGAAVVVGMWLQDTGTLTSLGDQLTAAGRVLGLVGTYLLLVQVLLMARIPWLDRLIGMDRLAVWHRRNGEYVVGLLSAHAVAITAGYALGDRISIFSETARVILHYPDVLAATVALGLLVLIGVISARAVRGRMAYHTWYFVHLYAYLAVALAFAHQLATGDEFALHPWHRWIWIGLHLATAGLLVGYRVVLPLRSALRQRLRVADVVVEGPGVVSIIVTGHRLAELDAEAGQFFLWRFLTRRGWWQAHPFSLSAMPDGRTLRITVKSAGDHTQWLQHVHPGIAVIAEGPYGALTGRRRRRDKVVLVAGGIGVAPLRALFEALPARAGDLTFLYRASSDADLVLHHELDDLARRRGARLFFATGPRTPDPLAPDALHRAIPDLKDHDAFVCGPPAFVDHAVHALRGAGLGRTHIHVERFEL